MMSCADPLETYSKPICKINIINKDYCYFTKILWLGMGNEDDYKITT